ncbi:MAG: DUF2791 family P-loop domain-containing protein [Anaerolineae bacterium]|nr:DUF2791 family P-loop domain-containing protein [Anaerolineae bacterium]
MGTQANLRAIVAEAKRKGYFDPDDHPKLRLSQQEVLELMGLLSKKGIPYGRPEVEVRPMDELTAKEALRIIDALRRGVPAAEGTAYYSVGRDDLLDRVAGDLKAVANGRSLVRSLNADIGQGKTHVLYLLREFAFAHDFAVSIVTLSQNSCPLYDFMAVYNQTMWGLRTDDQRHKPALSNIIDRWVEGIRELNPDRVRRIVEQELPKDLREIMAAYVDATNLFRPNETNRQLILKYLSGEKMALGDIRRLRIGFRLDSDNALQILSEMATTIRYIGFKGICILFDEADAIHSFAHSSQRDQAYANLQQIIQQSQWFPHCYFLYATTPSFFDSQGGGWLAQQLGSDSMLELGPLGIEERQAIATKICKVYARATGWEAPFDVIKVIHKAADRMTGERVGDYVRKTIAILDEKKVTA